MTGATPRRNPAAYPQTARVLATLAEGGVRVGLPLVLRLQQVEGDGGDVRARQVDDEDGFGRPTRSYVVVIEPRHRSLNGNQEMDLYAELGAYGFDIGWREGRVHYVIEVVSGGDLR